MSNQSNNAAEQTQFSLLKQTIFTTDHSVQQTINVLDEVFIDWMSSDFADDSETRYRVLHAHKNMKDLLFSVVFNQVTNEAKLIIEMNV